MTITFISKQNKKTKLLADRTNYLLPYSGTLQISDISSELIFVNGDAFPVENQSKTIPVENSSIELEVDGVNCTVRVLCRELSNETN